MRRRPGLPVALAATAALLLNSGCAARFARSDGNSGGDAALSQGGLPPEQAGTTGGGSSGTSTTGSKPKPGTKPGTTVAGSTGGGTTGAGTLRPAATVDGVPEPRQVLDGRIRHEKHGSTAPAVAAIGSAPWRVGLATE